MITPLMRPNPVTGNMLLCEELVIFLPVSGKTMTVKPGIEFNGFSSPQWSASITGMERFDPTLLGESIPHDMGFACQWEGWTEEMWNAELIALMPLNNATPAQIEEAKLGLEMGGWVRWNACAKDSEGIAYARRFASINAALSA